MHTPTLTRMHTHTCTWTLARTPCMKRRRATCHVPRTHTHLCTCTRTRARTAGRPRPRQPRPRLPRARPERLPRWRRWWLRLACVRGALRRAVVHAWWQHNATSVVRHGANVGRGRPREVEPRRCGGPATGCRCMHACPAAVRTPTRGRTATDASPPTPWALNRPLEARAPSHAAATPGPSPLADSAVPAKRRAFGEPPRAATAATAVWRDVCGVRRWRRRRSGSSRRKVRGQSGQVRHLAMRCSGVFRKWGSFLLSLVC